jgi:hypothetical protein
MLLCKLCVIPREQYVLRTTKVGDGSRLNWSVLVSPVASARAGIGTCRISDGAASSARRITIWDNVGLWSER